MQKIFLILTSISIHLSAQEFTADFEIFSGKWKSEEKNFTIFEEWRKINDTVYTGENYTIKNGSKYISEKLILLKINNYYAYIAQPGDNHPVLFTLTDYKKGRFSFENSEHDFPQKIIYNFNPDSSLIATIEGVTDGIFKKKQFRFIKTD